MSNELPKYQPYAPDTREGSNDFRENTGEKSNQRAQLNGWPWGGETTKDSDPPKGGK